MLIQIRLVPMSKNGTYWIDSAPSPIPQLCGPLETVRIRNCSGDHRTNPDQRIRSQRCSSHVYRAFTRESFVVVTLHCSRHYRGGEHVVRSCSFTRRRDACCAKEPRSIRSSCIKRKPSTSISPKIFSECAWINAQRAHDASAWVGSNFGFWLCVITRICKMRRKPITHLSRPTRESLLLVIGGKQQNLLAK